MHHVLKIDNLPVFRLPVPKLAVQGRYNIGVFFSVLTGSLQGIAERPLPCNYNVIQFKSRRGHQISTEFAGHPASLGHPGRHSVWAPRFSQPLPKLRHLTKVTPELA
jgi:hypothetical protein